MKSEQTTCLNMIFHPEGEIHVEEKGEPGSNPGTDSKGRSRGGGGGRRRYRKVNQSKT